MTIVVSFDIGIKNLAYCVMEYTPENVSGNQFKIYDWNVIDLLTAGNGNGNETKVVKTSKKCEHNQCTHNAHYTYTKPDETTMSLCRMHCKSYDQSRIDRLYQVSNVSMSELARLTIRKLDTIDFSLADEVIFESQPKINPKMKNLSMMLFNYFVIRYMVEKQKMRDVKFISSKNKLKVYDGPYIECELKNQYTRNKFYGKEYCQYLIRNDPERLRFFKTFRKKDDLADCFLQGAWYVMSSYKPPARKTREILPKIKITADQLKTNLPKPDLIADPPETEPATKRRITVSDLKTAPKHLIDGRQILRQIRQNETTRQIHIATNINKYRSMKPYKQRARARITMSGIKYLINQRPKPTDMSQMDQLDSQLKQAIIHYFGCLETFYQKCLN